MTHRASSIAFTALLALATLPAHAQFGWDPNCSSTQMGWNLDVNGVPATGDGIDSGGWNQWVSGVPAGADVGNENGRRIGYPSGQGPCSDIGNVKSYIRVKGLGTNQVTIDFLARAAVKHSCAPEVCQPWAISADLALDAVACLIINNGLGPDVTINYDYAYTARFSRRHEAGMEDPCNVANTECDVAGGQAGFAPMGLDMPDANFPGVFPLIQPTFTRADADSGSFTFDPTSGNLIVTIAGDVDAFITDPGNGNCTPDQPLPGLKDVGWAVVKGHISLGINQPPPPITGLGLSTPSPTPPGFNPGDLGVEFSLDIGSDAELSDTSDPANNRFDPGDLYPMGGLPMPPGGLDGIRNDILSIAAAPPPDPGPLAPAPQCTFPPIPDLPPLSMNFLDVDGSDALDFDLPPFIDFAAPLASPVARFDNSTVHPANHMLVSYDDDDATHYAWCSVAPSSLTHAGFAPYGDTNAADELHALDVLYALPLLGTVLGDTPVASERQVHRDMQLNPDPFEVADDDVDALDAQWTPGYADWWYYTVDHEAHSFDLASGAALDPGIIYMAIPGAPGIFPVVHPTTHLGLHAGVDIDAFEFVWLFHPAIQNDALAIIFSVDDDDPLTPADESAGLDPAMIYVSFFDGSSAPLLDDALDDDVDAITTWSRTLSSDLPRDCPADLAPPFGQLDFSDVVAFLVAFSNGDPAADLVPDGSFDFSDVIEFLNAFAQGCP